MEQEMVYSPYFKKAHTGPVARILSENCLQLSAPLKFDPIQRAASLKGTAFLGQPTLSD